MFNRLVPTLMLVAASVASGGAAGAGQLLRVEGDSVSWVGRASEQGAVVTYAVLSRSILLPTDARTLSPDNCGAMRPFAEIVSRSSGISDAMARRELRSAFDTWEEVAGIRFIEVSEPSRADIIVGATEGASGRAFANLSLGGADSTQPAPKALGALIDTRRMEPAGSATDTTVAAIAKAYVCLNPEMGWKIGFDGNLRIYDLRYTFTHEIGHAIGLDHPGSSGSIMGYRYDERVRQLQPSDIAAAQWLYGPPTGK